MKPEHKITQAMEEVFGADADDTEVLFEVGGRPVPLGEMRAVLNDPDFTPAAPPRRGSTDYAEIIRTVSSLDQQRLVIVALQGLWGDYGWRGVLDLMTAWVIQIETHPHLRSGAGRDMFGVVDLNDIVAMDGAPEVTLQVATEYTEEQLARDPDARPHEVLRKGLALGVRTGELGQAWRPFLHAAFAAAHHNPHDPLAVFGALYRAPGRDDKIKLVQMGIVVGTAAMGVRHMNALQRHAGRTGALVGWSEIRAISKRPHHG